MTHNFEQVMSKKSDEELLRILSQPEDYQPPALEAAQNEFGKRGLPTDRIEIIRQQAEQRLKAKEVKANQSLETHWKIVAFTLPTLIHIVFSAVFKANGYDRKTREFVRWTLFGFCFYIGAILLIVLLTYYGGAH